jgi:hypothetical protein
MPDPQPQPAEPPGRPRGKALRLTDEQLDAMAHVTDGDTPAAEDLWRRHAPPAYRDMLNTPKVEDGRR